MGIGMMLGLAQSIASWVGNVFNTIFTKIINWIVVPIIKQMIRVIIILVKYLTSIVFLEISKFLLGLIDFVEALFRSLAGLGAKDTGVSITMTLGGREGDLLISMLTSHEVIQAFYSTAIVGIFLLIITTIFQMIKVEYTTEGANNSKGGIIGKSLKSLCNMLIIPILCILGVFIGNEVLGLIDTATGGGEGTTISAQLWVAAGSEALVKENSLYHIKIKGLLGIETEKDYFNDVTNDAGLIAPAIMLAFDTIFNVKFEVSDDMKEEDPTATSNYSSTVGELITNAQDRDAAEAKYLSGALSIYDTKQMLTHYNPFEVNYLVLIFGACIIIKCLYHTCFGLIDRLYQCTALFIVMPMVVGMTPVKDSLGSWRSKFMSKALSAYGTVISLNLFFIIVKVMLAIDITVAGKTNGTAGTILSLFSSSFWEGLIKSIMVIVGCLMIEKLAGDLGGYFGGGNAMADGKGLAKDAMSGVTNAAKLAVGVASGGASLAIKGAGIAGKVAGGAYKVANKATGGALGDAVSWSGDKISQGAKAVGNWGVVKAGKKFVGSVGSVGKGVKTWFAEADAGVVRRGASDKKLKAAEEQLAKDEAAYNAAKSYSDGWANRNPKASDKKREKAQSEENTRNAEAKMKASRENLAKLRAKNIRKAAEHDKFVDYEKGKSEEKAQKSAERKAKFVKAKEGTRQLFEDKFGVGAMFNTFAPKPLQQLKKDYDSAVKTAMDASPEGQAMMGMLDKSKKDKAEADFDKRNAGAIEARHLAQTQLILKTTNEKLEVTNKETNKELSKMNETLNELISQLNNTQDEGKRSMLYSRIGNLQDAMKSKNTKIDFDEATMKVKSEEMLKVDFKMDANFMKKIEEQVKKGVKMDDIMEQISEEFKKMGINDKDTLAKIYKALDELRSNFGGK